MRKLLNSCAGLALLVCGSSAMAATGDVNGTVDVTGYVLSKCTVLVDGGTSSTFNGLIALGQLDGDNGRINSALTGSSIGGASQSFTVVCNSNTPSVALSATTMGDGVTALSGYTSLVDYTAKLDLNTTSGTQTYSYDTYPGGAATTGTLSNPLAAAADNVTVSVNSVNTDGGANTSILTAGNYGVGLGGSGGVISVTISP